MSLGVMKPKYPMQFKQTLKAAHPHDIQSLLRRLPRVPRPVGFEVHLRKR